MTSLRSLCAALAVLILAVAGGISLTACGRSEAAVEIHDGRIVVEFWHAMGRQNGQTVNSIAQAFNDSQDKYMVRPVYQGSYNSLSQKLIASLYAGTGPALSQMYPGWTTRFYKYDYLTPVEHFFEADPDFTGEDLQDFFPVMIAENTLRHPESGVEELVTLPFNKSVYVLFVNQTRMEELGWEQPPQTWEELRQLAADMTIRPEGGGAPSMYGFATRPFIEDLTVQAMAADTQLLDEQAGEVVVDQEPVRAAWNYLMSLVAGEDGEKIGYVETDYLSNVFGSQRVGMYISSTASFTYNDMAVGDKFIWRAYAVPSRDEKTEGKTLMQGTNVGIFATAPEETQQGAWEFLKFLTSREMTAKWAKATGYMPVRRSAKQLPEFKQFLEDQVSYANAVETLERAAFEPRATYWESVRSLISREVEATLLGRETLDQAVELAADEMRALMEE